MMFKRAKPIWLDGKDRSPNCHAGFFAFLPRAAEKSCTLRIACCTMYRIFINGTFFAYGPARGPEGFFRVDEREIGGLLNKGTNSLAIEVIGSNSDTFCTVDQPSFLTCEVLYDGDVQIYTDRKGSFSAKLCRERVVKAQRYSFQRGYYETYVFWPEYDKWCVDGIDTPEICAVSRVETKRYLPRRSPFPLFEKTPACKIVDVGRVAHRIPETYNRNDTYLNPGPSRTKFFPHGELECCVTDEAQEFTFLRDDVSPDFSAISELKLANGRYATLDMGCLLTGFLGFTIQAESDVVLYCLYDELLTNGDVDFLRAGCSNVLKLSFKSGETRFLAFDPVCFRYVKIVCVGGSCQLKDIHMREYRHPPVENRVCLPPENEKLLLIYNAAVETFRQNAVDLFMDCPGRERAGWLCDSFFTARVEKLLTGGSDIETDFLENFLLPDRYAHIPDGMFPMCYPADHGDGNYIPNWAMWLVLELEEYRQRVGNSHMTDLFRPKVESLLQYLSTYENADGLLEKLECWVFVEWSRANELTQDVNYPTNMLYAATLAAAGRLYDCKEWSAKADTLQEKLRERSFDGRFFVDNAVYKDGILKNSGESTEVCQYYAFFCGTATPEMYPEIWKTLVDEFGPKRRMENRYPEVAFANAFIGNYLRIECLMRYGLTEQVLEDVEGYFYRMAATTGTLWEKDSPDASCDHGFASHVVYWLGQMFGSMPVA